jgi:hypothetical protein
LKQQFVQQKNAKIEMRRAVDIATHAVPGVI